MTYRERVRRLEDDMTLGDARRLVLEGREEPNGIVCPCCSRRSKVYRRKLHTEMALFLVTLYRIGTKEWSKMRDIVASKPKRTTEKRIYGTDAGYLAHWGLISRRREGASCRITRTGQRFVRGEISVPRYAHISNDNICERFSGEAVTIQEALGDNFNLEELLNEREHNR